MVLPAFGFQPGIAHVALRLVTVSGIAEPKLIGLRFRACPRPLVLVVAFYTKIRTHDRSIYTE